MFNDISKKAKWYLNSLDSYTFVIVTLTFEIHVFATLHIYKVFSIFVYF